jgi:hypothetical protein
MGARERKVLNGLVVGLVPGVTRERRLAIRSGIHKVENDQIPIKGRSKFIRGLEGNINQLTPIKPQLAARFRQDLLRAQSKLPNQR